MKKYNSKPIGIREVGESLLQLNPGPFTRLINLFTGKQVLHTPAAITEHLFTSLPYLDMKEAGELSSLVMQNGVYIPDRSAYLHFEQTLDEKGMGGCYRIELRDI